MASKKGKRRSRGSSTGLIEPAQEDEVQVGTKDPYKEYRYVPLSFPPTPPPPVPKMKTVSVLKRKTPLPSISNNRRSFELTQDQIQLKQNQEVKYEPKPPVPVLPTFRRTSRSTIHRFKSSSSETRSKLKSGSKWNIKEPDFEILSEEVMLPDSLGVYVSPGAKSLIPPPIEVLRIGKNNQETYTQSLDVSFLKEASTLYMQELRYLEQMEMENYLVKMTGKDHGSLLVRRDQVLPRYAPNSQEKEKFTIERTETPRVTPELAFFPDPLWEKNEKNGIRPTMTRRQRKYDVVTDWIGCPEVTDGILTFLGENLRSKDQDRPPKTQLKENGEQQNSSEFIPFFENLGVVSFSYERAQQRLRDKVKCHGPYEAVSSLNSSKDFSSENVGLSTQEEVGQVIEAASRVGLSIGELHLQWSNSPETLKVERVVEIGCTTDVGVHAVNSVFMENTGTTAIHFNWVKKPHEGTLKIRHFNEEPFVFDSWGGTILPGETFRIPFMYKAIAPGYYSEDWRLLTKPVLENGAEVIIRLWGLTRQYDPYHWAKDCADEALQSRIMWSIVEQRVGKIIDFLPLKEVPLQDTRFPLNYLGADLFHVNNPWLYYHSAAVYRLTKLGEIVEAYTEMSLPSTESAESSEAWSEIRSTPAERTPGGSMFKTPDEIMFRTRGDSAFRSPIDGMPAHDISVSEENQMNIDEALEDSKTRLEETEYYEDEGEGTQAQRIKIVKAKIRQEISFDNLNWQTVHGPDNIVEPPQKDDEIDLEPISGEPSSKSLAHTKALINLMPCDIIVHQLREHILRTGVSIELQEAFFELMTEDIDKMLFRTEPPLSNWKQIMCRTKLCSAMDEFAEYAAALQRACCKGQMLTMVWQNLASLPFYEDAEGSVVEDEEGEEPVKQPPKKEPKKEKLSITPDQKSVADTRELSTPSGSIISCGSRPPREAFSETRFRGVFYPALYARMYDLLGDFVDTIPMIIAKNETQIDYGEQGFIKIRNIPMDVSVADMLEAPLPPHWVRIAQRMDDAIQSIRQRKEEVEEQEFPLQESQRHEPNNK